MTLSSNKNILRMNFMMILLILTAIFLSPATEPAQRLKWYEDHAAMKEKSMFKHLPWQFLGPTNISGRMTDVAIVAPKGKNYTIYAAGASGGLWKTINEGVTWEPIFQHAASTSIGDVTIAPSNPDIIWIGTGEANIFRSSMAGAGVYKSTDAGKTWQHMGLAGTHTIPRIIIHPENQDIVYAAASGHEWTDNKDRGLYKTTDGGKTWSQVFYINEKTGVIDLVMDPSNPDTLYAATWQRIRKRWKDPRNDPGYTGSGVFKTTDGGKTWLPMDNGLPPAKYRGRIGIDLCRAKPNVIYAFIDNYEVVGQWSEGETDSYGRPKTGMIKGATVFRSDNGGQNWRQVSRDNNYMRQLSATYGWVFGQVRVDPLNENKIYVMGLFLNVSEDAGETFRTLDGIHLDQHGLWIDPANTDYLVNVNDGGLAVSYDGGKNWRTFTKNFPLVQFFTVAYDMAEPFYVYGSIQDHGSYRAKVDLGKGRNQIPAQEWEEAPGGEGSRHAIDPVDPNIVYSAYFYGTIFRTDLSTKKSVNIVPKAGKDEPPLRGQWLAPFILSPHNPRILYHGMNFLFRSMNRGDSWEKISPDLTYNDKNKLGDIQYQTIFTISESPLKFGLIYVGTDDGRVHVTRDSGITWAEITKGLPQGKWVSRLEASAFDLGAVYMTQNGKRDDDFAAYVWKSVDFGKTWTDISNNIPCGPVNVIREDPMNKNILYVGTDLGVYISLDGGKYWQTLADKFPTTYVHDLAIHPRDNILLAATHGRGMFVMDVSKLQQLTGDIKTKQAHLFDILAAKLPVEDWGGWYGAQDAYFDYYLREPQEVKFAIKDASGKIIKEIKGTGDVGLNSAVWDLTQDLALITPPTPPEAGKVKKEDEEPAPAYVKPGKYTVVLTAGSISLESPFEVKEP
ncbi:MAG: hypothetical protein NT166_01090 [Candidatus Aminicenantes bacterium]|nr:hypothetical protein [Candidatus Aminicenantes bacterium]